MRPYPSGNIGGAALGVQNFYLRLFQPAVLREVDGFVERDG